MTTYLLVALVVTVPLSAASLLVLARAGRSALLPALAALVVLVAATAVFDNVIVGTGIVAYDPRLILGVRVGVAPIEDFSYAVVASLGLPALWVLLPARRVGR